LVEGALLLVRADASQQIGAGHFMRCLALSQAWQEHGGTAIFLMASGAAALAKRLADGRIGEVRLSAPAGSIADADETAEVALQHNAAWIALDGYHFSAEYQRVLKEKIAHLLLFDDVAEADRYHADLLINQNAYATPEMYADRAGNCTLLLGAPYFLLRREFREWRDRERQIASHARNLLVTFGGSDAENATTLALQALALLSPPAMNVRVLVGASNPHRPGLERLAATLPHSVEFQIDSKRVADEMAWADLAISAAGSTSWELAFMGLPSLLVTLSQNQHGCAQYLHGHDIAVSLGWQQELQPAEMAAALSALAADPARRAEMSSRGRHLIDGRGAGRVVQAMASIATAAGQLHLNAPRTSSKNNG
jgi:UDP-2,4-diacetamido-2,4,6-trideoxy-beta-L-altropyranose hydrolase